MTPGRGCSGPLPKCPSGRAGFARGLAPMDSAGGTCIVTRESKQRQLRHSRTGVGLSPPLAQSEFGSSLLSGHSLNR